MKWCCDPRHGTPCPNDKPCRACAVEDCHPMYEFEGSYQAAVDQLARNQTEAAKLAIARNQFHEDD
jgi:hypothetical protein